MPPAQIGRRFLIGILHGRKAPGPANAGPPPALLRRSGYAKAKKRVKFLPLINVRYKTKYTPLQGGRGAAHTVNEYN